ncbi:MAG: hypothetical protein ACIALR_11075 [Blastopirellula sp. JB062]
MSIEAISRIDWVNKAIDDASELPLGVAPSTAATQAEREVELRREIELAWEQVSQLFWQSPEHPEAFRTAELDLRIKSLIARSLAGWLPAPPKAMSESVTEEDLASIEQFILDEEYAQSVAARPEIDQPQADVCPPIPPVVERPTFHRDRLEAEEVQEVASLLDDDAAPLTDEEIAYLHSGPSDFLLSLDPYGYSEYNDYLDDEEGAPVAVEKRTAWAILIAEKIVAASRSTKEGFRWIGDLKLAEQAEKLRRAHQAEEIRRYRTAERQLLERWDAVIDGFHVLR